MQLLSMYTFSPSFEVQSLFQKYHIIIFLIRCPQPKTFEMKLFEKSRTFGKLVKLLQQLPVSLAFDVTKSFELYVSCLKSRITKLPLSLSQQKKSLFSERVLFYGKYLIYQNSLMNIGLQLHAFQKQSKLHEDAWIKLL